jgi:peptidylamidoglycolate lyase
MYYTDNTDIGAEFQSCGYLCNAEQNRAYPADSIQPLPPNPILEAYAIHGKMNHQLRTNSSTGAIQEMPIVVEPIIIDNTNNSSQHETSNGEGLMVDHDVHHHVEMESTTNVAEPAAVTITQATKEVIRREKVKGISSKSDTQKKDDNFWSFLFFYRRFFS